MLPDDGSLPAPVVEVLAPQRPQRTARSVGDPEAGIEVDDSTGSPQPVVQLGVLAALQALIEPADPIQRGSAKHPEVDGVGRARPPSRPVAGVAHTEGGGLCQGDGALDERLALGRLDASHIVGARLGEHGDGPGDVAGGEDRMRIAAGDDGPR